MLQVKKGAEEYRMSYAIWFAIGTAYALHSLYMTPDMVVTDFEIGNPDARTPHERAHRVKLRTKDLADFDATHWCGVCNKQLQPMGFLCYLEVQHLVIEFQPSRVSRLYDVVA